MEKEEDYAGHHPFLTLPTMFLERPPREWEVVGSIPGRDKPKSLKLVVVGQTPPPPRRSDYGNSTATDPPVSG